VRGEGGWEGGREGGSSVMGNAVRRSKSCVSPIKNRRLAERARGREGGWRGREEGG
jgi:hypothetical protein